MDTDQNIFAVADIATHERDVRLVVQLVLVGGMRNAPWSVGRAAVATRLYQPLRPHPVLDEIRDRDHQQPVLLGKFVSSGTRAIVPSSFITSQMTPAG